MAGSRSASASDNMAARSARDGGTGPRSGIRGTDICVESDPSFPDDTLTGTSPTPSSRIITESVASRSTRFNFASR